MKYLTLKTSDNELMIILEQNDTKIFIPIDPANSDYQEYLKWVEENND
jgi:hypothetical protein